ncbi:MAG: hypothetical protein FH748_04420 [Balneolaceae bacterium]|nr:hypothetical protein [Balneolaceae bacterium]
MKISLIRLFYLGACILVVAGIINYNINEQSSLSIYEELGSSYDTEFINLKNVLTNFGVDEYLISNNQDLTVIYLTNYSQCANIIVEIKEFSVLFDSMRIQKDVKITEVFLLLDENRQRAIKELKMLDLAIPSGLNHQNNDTNVLTRFGKSDLSINQIIFIDKNQEIRFRNRLSGIIDVPIEHKKRVIERGMQRAL